MPAAAVIPAPIAYIKVVAVKKLVVGFRSGPVGPPQGVLLTGLLFFAKTACACMFVCVCMCSEWATDEVLFYTSQEGLRCSRVFRLDLTSNGMRTSLVYEDTQPQ